MEDNRDCCIGILSKLLFLSFTYMTDVPFLSFMIWFCFCIIRGVRRQQDRWLVAAVICIGLSVGVRLVGVALAPAMLASLLVHSGRWGRVWFRLLMPFGAVLFAAFLMLWHSSHIEHRTNLRWIENSPEWRKENLKWSVPQMPRSTAISVTLSAGMFGVALAPLAIGTFRRRNLGRTTLVLGGLATTLAVQMWSVGWYVAPLAVDQLWGAYGVGHMDRFVPNYNLPEMPGWWTWVCGVLGFGLFSMALAPAVRRVGHLGYQC